MRRIDPLTIVVSVTIVVSSTVITVLACSSTVRTSATSAPSSIQTVSSLSAPNEDNCWLVESSSGAIQFKLLKFDVPNNNDCETAWLTIYDGYSVRDKIITVICRDRGPGREYYTGGYGLVRFQTGPQYKTGEFAIQFSQANKFYLSNRPKKNCSGRNSVTVTTMAVMLIMYQL